MKLKLVNVRLSYPQLFVAKEFKPGDGNPCYSASFLIGADDPQADVINDAIDQVAVAKWAEKAKGILAQLRGADKVCMHNGDSKADNEGYAGSWFLSARNSPKRDAKPLILDQLRQTVTPDSGIPYGGCYVDAIVEIYAQDNEFGKRVNATLKAVQYRGPGVAFAGGPPATPDDFDDISDQGAEAGADLA